MDEYESEVVIQGSGYQYPSNLTDIQSYFKTPDVTSTIWHPPLSGVPATPGIPPTAAVISKILNQGWNAHARSLNIIPVGGYYEFSVATGVGGACLGIGPDGMDSMGIAAFTHSIICDRDGIHVHEGGELVHSLKNRQYSTSILRIYRLANEVITFVCTTDSEVLTYTSETPYPAAYPMYVYGLLYDSGDSIITSLIENGESSSNSIEFNLELGMLFKDSLVGDAFVKFEVELNFATREQNKIIFEFELDTLFRASSNYGYAILPAMQSIGGELPAGYGAGYSILPRLTCHGEGGFYIPPALEYGFAYLPRLVCFGHAKTSHYGDGDSALPVVASKGGEGDYGEGNATLPALHSRGSEGPPKNYAYAYSVGFVFAGAIAVQDQIVFIDWTGTITDTISGTRDLIASTLASLTATGSFSVLGSFLIAADASLTTTVSATATQSVKTVEETIVENNIGTEGVEVIETEGPSGEAIVTTVTTVEDTPGVFTITTVVETTAFRPSVDSESRVWVVNVESGASSQYDGYGFNSWIERDGEVFGLAEDGIYKLTGFTDAGFPIPWEVDFGTTNCGVNGRKKIPNVHVSTTAGGPMYLKVTTESGTQTYKVESCLRGSTGWRAKIYEDMYGTAWNFTLISEGEAELEGVEFAPIKLSRSL